jgi:hypothetical protein
LVTDFAGTTFTDAPLTQGTTYYYTLFAYNAGGGGACPIAGQNFATGAQIQGTVPTIARVTVLAKPEKRVPRTGHWDVQAQLVTRPPGTVIAFTDQIIQTDLSGNALVDVAAPVGTYDFALKGVSYLRTVVHDVGLLLTGTVLDFTQGGIFALLAGDVHSSNDNFINSLDLSVLLNKLNTGNVVSDLNADGKVNSLDLNMLLTNLSKRGEN